MEELCEGACIIRLSNVYGPGSKDKNSVIAKMFKDAIRTGTITVIDGKQERDFIYIDDVVNTIRGLVEEKSIGIWEVRSGEYWRINDVAKIISEMTGAKIVHKIADERTVEHILPDVSTHMDFIDGLERTYDYFRSL